jgi:radical SAM superfamily enzyme YgiQ (UPF0313 family)
MNFLLIAPPLNIAERYGIKIKFKKGYLPPISLLQIGAVIEQAGHNVKILDLNVTNISRKNFKVLIEEFSPDIVGFTTLTVTSARAFEIAKFLDTLTDALIVFGGPHVAVFPEKTMEEQKHIDCVVTGEGEYVLLEIAEAIKNKKSLKKIKGICFREKNKIIRTLGREFIKNLDELPFPAYHLVDLNNYSPLPNQYRRLPAINMITGRGCPWGKCTYCFEAAQLGYFRRMSPERAIELIKKLVNEYGIKEISFWDDIFVAGGKWMDTFCELIEKEKIDLTWSCYARVDMVKKETLKKMKKAGCWNIFYGIESGNQDLLDKIKKGITIKQAIDAVRWTGEAGIETRGALMFALPGETPEKAEKTINFAIKLDLDYVQFAFTTPFYGTELFEQCLAEGRLDTDFKKWSSFEPVYIPQGYKNKAELQKVLKRAYRKFYFRPEYFFKKINSIHSLGDIMRLAYGFKLLLGFMNKG